MVLIKQMIKSSPSQEQWPTLGNEFRYIRLFGEIQYL